MIVDKKGQGTIDRDLGPCTNFLHALLKKCRWARIGEENRKTSIGRFKENKQLAGKVFQNHQVTRDLRHTRMETERTNKGERDNIGCMSTFRQE